MLTPLLGDAQSVTHRTWGRAPGVATEFGDPTSLAHREPPRSFSTAP